MNISIVARAIENFPTLPTVYSALLELLSDIDTKISEHSYKSINKFVEDLILKIKENC